MENRLLKKRYNLSLIPVIFTLAWPTMLEQIMGTAVQYIDTAMVGSLGTSATAAVGSTTTVNWLMGSTVSAFGVGFLAYISQANGAGDRDRARRASAQSVFTVLTVGILFTALALSLSRVIPVWMQVDEKILDLASTYFFIIYTPMIFRVSTNIFGTVLRAAGDTRTPMRVGVLMNIINVVLNYLLIYETRLVRLLGLTVKMPGAGLGVVGAALASAVSFTVGGVCIFAALWSHPEISPKGVSMKPDMEILRPCIKVAVPNILQRFCTSLGYVVFASMINSLGEVATAAHTVANTVESAFYVPGYGMMTASATLTGNCFGAGDWQRQKDISRLIILIEVAMMVLSGGLLLLFAPRLVMLFSKSPEVIALGSRVLRMVALIEPFYGASIVIEGMLMGAGDTTRPFRYSVGTMWGIRILGTFICVSLLGMGLVSAWACMIANNMALFLLFAIYYRTGFERLWKKG